MDGRVDRYAAKQGGERPPRWLHHLHKRCTCTTLDQAKLGCNRSHGGCTLIYEALCSYDACFDIDGMMSALTEAKLLSALAQLRGSHDVDSWKAVTALIRRSETRTC